MGEVADITTVAKGTMEDTGAIMDTMTDTTGITITMGMSIITMEAILGTTMGTMHHTTINTTTTSQRSLKKHPLSKSKSQHPIRKQNLL